MGADFSGLHGFWGAGPGLVVTRAYLEKAARLGGLFGFLLSGEYGLAFLRKRLYAFGVVRRLAGYLLAVGFVV